MLELHVGGTEFFNEDTCEFIPSKETVLKLEHSLISVSKWESKWHKPFLGNTEMTQEELFDYIRCMTITQSPDPTVYDRLTVDDVSKIRDYMADTMTATWFNDRGMPKSRQKAVTSELIYYWMIALQIPVEFERWHLNRLLTLIRVCNIENSPKKKMRTNEIMRQNASLNEQRKRAMGTRG